MRDTRANRFSMQLSRELGPIDSRTERHYCDKRYDDIPKSTLSAELIGWQGIKREVRRQIEAKHRFEFSS